MTNHTPTTKHDFKPKYNSEYKEPMGVVIPGFGHPKFLAEAIVSACNQNIDCQVYIVVVDDGCKFPETAQTVRDLMKVYPGKLFYFRQKNTRLPGARNAGIRFLLDLDRTIETIYFLDADNRLAPYSLQSFRKALGDDPKIGWAYPDIGFFGLSWGINGFDVRETSPNYSVFKHLVANISEAGSLVRTSVFKSGVFFDETMRSGFEDWDFWLSAIEAGYVGIRAEHSGFRYRRRSESMLAEARREADVLLGYIQSKHSALFSSDFIAECEHKEAPYFAVLLNDVDEVYLFSDPVADDVKISKAEFDLMITNWLTDEREFFFPKLILSMSKNVWAGLQERTYILRPLFWKLRSKSKGFEYYMLKAGLRLDVLNNQETETNREAMFGALPSNVFQKLLKADVGLERKVIGKPYRSMVEFPDLPINFIEMEAGSSPVFHEAFKKEKEKKLRDVFLTLLQNHRDFLKPMNHLDRRFAGPSALAVRDQLMPVVFGDDIQYEPYVCTGEQKQRLLIAARGNQLYNDQYRALKRLLDASEPRFKEVIVALDYEGDFDVRSCKIPVGEYSNIKDIYTYPIKNVSEEFGIYLHRQMKVYFEHGDIYKSSLMMRNAGTVFMIGDTAFIEAHGEARKNGAIGYLWLEQEFFYDHEELDLVLHKVLAYEHALQAIVTDSQYIKQNLSAYGVPIDKILGVDEAIKMVFFDDE